MTKKISLKSSLRKKGYRWTPKRAEFYRIRQILGHHFDYEMKKYDQNGWGLLIGSPYLRKKKSIVRFRYSIVKRSPVPRTSRDAFMSHNVKAYFFGFSVPRDNAPTGCLSAILPLIKSIEYKKGIGVIADIEIIIEEGFKTSFSELSIRDGYGPMEAKLRLSYRALRPFKDVEKIEGILKIIDVTPKSPEDCGKTFTIHTTIDVIQEAYWDEKKGKYRSLDLRKLELSIFTLEAELGIAEGPETAPRFSASSGAMQIRIDNSEKPTEIRKFIYGQLREE